MCERRGGVRRTAWLLEPSSLPPSYVSFLNKHGGKPVGVIRGLRELAGNNGHLTPDIAHRIAQAWDAAAAAPPGAGHGAGSVAKAVTKAMTGAVTGGVTGAASGVPSALSGLFAAAGVAGSRAAVGKGASALAGAAAQSVGGGAAGAAAGIASALCHSQAPCPVRHWVQYGIVHHITLLAIAKHQHLPWYRTSCQASDLQIRFRRKGQWTFCPDP